MYSKRFRTGRIVFLNDAWIAEEFDVLIRQETGGKKRLRESFHPIMSGAAKSEHGFHVDELPGLIRSQ
jgi:hypothetical protein